MDCKLFDARSSVSASETVRVGSTCSTHLSTFRQRCGVSSLRRCSHSRKASYSSSPNRQIGPSGHEKSARETSSYVLNGNNRVTSSLFARDSSILKAFDDEYGGVVVDPESLPANPSVFASLLHSSLCHWKIEGKKGIWLKLPLSRSELVPVAVKEGFQYHHAEQGYVMLTYWIPEGPCMLPSNASHQVGVGGFVINDENEVLVVQEKYCNPASVGLWKLPTGFILEAEEIFAGAIREVKEETGIDTKFTEVIAFRHVHNVAFQKSDLFFICMLTPLSNQIIVDDHEIQAAKWMPLVEFIEQPLIQEDCMFMKIIDICIARLGKCYCGLSAHQVVSKFDGKLSCLYYNVIEAGD